MWKIGVLVVFLVGGLIYLLAGLMDPAVDAWKERDKMSSPEGQAQRTLRNRQELVEIPPPDRPRRVLDQLWLVEWNAADPRVARFGNAVASLRGNQVLYARAGAQADHAVETRLRLAAVNRLLADTLAAFASGPGIEPKLRVAVYDDASKKWKRGEAPEARVWAWLSELTTKASPWFPDSAELQITADSMPSSAAERRRFPARALGISLEECVAKVSQIRAPEAAMKELITLGSSPGFLDPEGRGAYSVQSLRWSFPASELPPE